MNQRRRHPQKDRSGRIVFWRTPELPGVEGRQAFGSHATYRAHTHSALSIGRVDRGRSTLRIGKRAIPLKSGDVVVIAPGQVHSCNPRNVKSWSYRMFYIDPDWFVSGPGKLPAFPNAVLSGSAVAKLVDRLEQALCARTGSAKRSLTFRNAVSAILQRCTKLSFQTKSGRASCVGKARAFIDAHCFDRVTLSCLANVAETSPYRLIRQFKQTVGLTPHAYQLDRRINLTRDMLQRGHRIADVAYAAGFSDQSHFQRAFKTRVAATPLEYQSGRSPTPGRQPRQPPDRSNKNQQDPRF